MSSEKESKLPKQQEEIRDLLELLLIHVGRLYYDPFTADWIKELAQEENPIEFPIVRFSLLEEELCLFVLSEHDEEGSFLRFLQLVSSKYLIPDKKRVPYENHYFTCRAPNPPRKRYGVATVKVQLHNATERLLLQEQLVSLTHMIQRAAKFPEHAFSFLMQKSFGPAEKRKDYILNYFKRVAQKPPFSKKTLLGEEEQSFLLALVNTPQLTNLRSPKQLARIACSFALIREQARQSQSQLSPCFRLFPMDVQFTFGKKRRLALCLGMGPLDAYQLFNEPALLRALRKCIPQAQIVLGSFFHYHHSSDPTHLLYAEVEKEEEAYFSSEELKYLKNTLAAHIEASIETVVPALFVTSNEEEMMKNILTLRHELQDINDAPQVILSFERQSANHITYLISLVSVVEQKEDCIQEKLSQTTAKWEYVPLRNVVVSGTQDEMTKHAYLFRLKIEKSPLFTRSDSSVNLNLARQHVVDLLKKELGPIRDYTGGMINLQNTLFVNFKEKYGKVEAFYPKLLEDFFYSFHPIDAQLTLPVPIIYKLFDTLLEVIRGSRNLESHTVLKEACEGHIFVIASLPPNAEDTLFEQLKNNKMLKGSVLSTKVISAKYRLCCLIYHPEAQYEEELFVHQVEDILSSHIKKEAAKQVLHIPIHHLPTPLDPRLFLSSSAHTVINLLFDGLFRVGIQGEPEPAVAESYTISPDGKIYTFHLRETYWNNGDPVTANDFVYAWKKMLSPSFQTHFAYLFYAIKNAEEAKAGNVSLDSVGIYAQDPLTLAVELEQPTPHFLHYLSLNVFFPVHQKIEELHPDWSLHPSPRYTCNGPFNLEKFEHNKDISLVKNTYYWDQKHVYLEQIHFNLLRKETLSINAKNRKMDWVGAPFIPSTKIDTNEKKDKQQLGSLASANLILNTQQYPLNNKKLRQAIRYAINTKALLQKFRPQAKPAYSILPPCFSQLRPQSVYNPEEARVLLKEALHELQIDVLPSLNFLQPIETNKGSEKMFDELRKQITSVLGVNFSLKTPNINQVEQKRSRGAHFLVSGWAFLCNSPFYLLEAFAETKDEHKLYPWTNQSYRKWLKANHTSCSEKEQIAKLEKILLDELPAIPLYHTPARYSKNPQLKNVIQHLGAVNLKTAYLKLPV